MQIACAGTGQDGDLRMGVKHSFVDNLDGTITDEKTGLTFEKLSDDGTIHDKDAALNWPGALAKAETLATDCFAGHCDWRLPNRFELDSLLNLSGVSPAVFPPFDTDCVPGCTVLTCSCTAPIAYWSSTSYAPFAVFAWFVDFNDGGHGTLAKKPLPLTARAVRGGR